MLYLRISRIPLRMPVLFLLLAGLLLSGAVSLAQQDEHGEGDKPIHWTYEGEEGPDHWGDLSQEFALCSAGLAESPIDLTGTTALNLSDIEFDYTETAISIFNNGHTIQVNVDEGSTITYNGLTYTLLQFHFHRPSEHTVDGEHADMEIHFVHQDTRSTNLAVVGVLLVAGDPENETGGEAYAPIFDHLPAETGEPEVVGEALDLNTLLPEDRRYTTYNGSLTTPPCSEIVRWLVLAEPVELSVEQIDAFADIHEMNARPVQPLNGRDLLTDSN